MSAAGVAEVAGLALLVAATTACIDFAGARYQRAANQHRRHRAARWSVVHWVFAFTGLAIAVKVSVWYLLAEPIGLYLGTCLGVGAEDERVGAGQTDMREHYDHVTTVRCLVCGRDVAGVRQASTRELLVSRHLRASLPVRRTDGQHNAFDALGFCPGSLAQPDEKK